MLKELIDFVDSILPSVPMDTKEGIKSAITQFEKNGEQINFLTLEPLKNLSQGDIISQVPFCYFDIDGKQKIFKADALVLSTSCHIDQKDKLVLVPVFPLNSFKGDIIELKKNTIIDYMYIPDAKLKNSYIDFEIMNSFNRDLIFAGLSTGSIERIASFNQIGYYLFIIKLTIYLMRREDSGTLEERNLNLIGV